MALMIHAQDGIFCSYLKNKDLLCELIWNGPKALLLRKDIGAEGTSAGMYSTLQFGYVTVCVKTK